MYRAFRLMIVLLIFGCNAGLSQVNVGGSQKAESFNKNIYGLGVSAGPASGIGISFRNHLPSRSSYQLVGGIIKTGNKVSATIGGQFQYDLVRGSTARFYFGPGASYFYSGDKQNDFKGPFRFGIGLGAELALQQAMHVTLEGMFTYFSDGYIVPLPQVSVHYYFF